MDVAAYLKDVPANHLRDKIDAFRALIDVSEDAKINIAVGGCAVLDIFGNTVDEQPTMYLLAEAPIHGDIYAIAKDIGRISSSTGVWGYVILALA